MSSNDVRGVTEEDERLSHRAHLFVGSSSEANSQDHGDSLGTHQPKSWCELTKSGLHCGKVTGVAITWILVLFVALTYIFNFLIPSLGRGEWNGVLGLFLFGPSFGLLLVSMWRTMFTHPGRVNGAFDIDYVNREVQDRRRRHGEELERKALEREGAVAASSAIEGGNNSPGTETNVGSTGTPTPRSTTAGRVPTSSIYNPPVYTPTMCTKCYVYKVNRIHHCSSCGDCILRMDHHCPWIGQCVGRDNHKYFILFLGYTCLCGFIIAGTSYPSISLLGIGARGHGSHGQSIAHSMLMFFAWMFSLIFAIVLLPFMIATLSNATDGTTTLEKKIRNREKTRRRQRRRDRRRSTRELRQRNIARATVEGGHSIVQMGPNDPLSSDSESDEELEPCCDCGDWSSLGEIFGDSEESKTWLRVWWFLPSRPSFKPDAINYDLFFPTIDTSNY